MIGYITLGTNDLKRAVKFYDALLEELGAKRFTETGQFTAWTGADSGPGLSLTVPFDGRPATAGNGTMVALAAASKEQVDRIYKKALALGGTDEGPPGQRMEGFYAAYFRDPDGNKLNAFFTG